MAGSQYANIDGVLAALGVEAERLSRVIEGAAASGWKRVARVDGHERTALQLLAGPLYEADHHFHEYESLLDRATPAPVP
jgi:hypothetical protein